MQQIVINVENPQILASLKKILSLIDGVTIVSQKKRKCGMDEAVDDIREGRVYKADSVEDMFKQILG